MTTRNDNTSTTTTTLSYASCRTSEEVRYEIIIPVHSIPLNCWNQLNYTVPPKKANSPVTEVFRSPWSALN